MLWGDSCCEIKIILFDLNKNKAPRSFSLFVLMFFIDNWVEAILYCFKFDSKCSGKHLQWQNASQKKKPETPLRSTRARKGSWLSLFFPGSSPPVDCLDFVHFINSSLVKYWTVLCSKFSVLWVTCSHTACMLTGFTDTIWEQKKQSHNTGILVTVLLTKANHRSPGSTLHNTFTL